MLIKREDYLSILRNFKDKQIIKVITGIRRCGKSTLLELFQDYLKEIKEGIEEHKIEIDELISHNLKQNWSLNRISKINLSLIKIAIFEMLYLDLPYKIAINEVVELAKKYADDQAPVFINGILASVVKEKNLNGDTYED